jgi:hypothetical protein
MRPYVLTVFALMLVSACAEPKCPSGYMQYGDVCRRCKPGEERERGQCVMVWDGGDSVDAGSKPDEPSDDAEATRDSGAAEMDADNSQPVDQDAGLSGGDSSCCLGQDGGDATIGLADAAHSDATVVDNGINDCEPNPCQRGGTCVDGPATYACTCPSGSTGTRCELDICGNTNVLTSADLLAARQCAEVQGNLSISTQGLGSITASDFPHLRKVTGDLLVGPIPGSARTPQVELITLPQLQTIEGGLSVTAASSLRELHLPALTTVGTSADANRRFYFTLDAEMQVLDLPVLTTINGSMEMRTLSKLCTLKIGALTRVTGTVLLLGMPNVPASTFEPATSAALGAVTQDLIGCCFPTDDVKCDGVTQADLDAFCGC